MWAAHTFVNIAQLTRWEALWNWGFPSDHTPTAELSLPLELVTISSAWRVQPYWGQASSRKQSPWGRHSLSKILKLQATFLYSIYHQRAGKTNLFHMRGGRFHAFNTWCTFNVIPKCLDSWSAETVETISAAHREATTDPGRTASATWWRWHQVAGQVWGSMSGEGA